MANCTLDVAEDLVVPKSYDAPIAALEPSGSSLIGLAIRMLAAVGLDDEAPLEADKIDNARTEPVLASELVSL